MKLVIACALLCLCLGVRSQFTFASKGWNGIARRHEEAQKKLRLLRETKERPRTVSIKIPAAILDAEFRCMPVSRARSEVLTHLALVS